MSKKQRTRYEEIAGKIITATPVITTGIYLLIGFTTNQWHPWWVVFFLIPLVPAVLKPANINVVFPIVIIVIYLIIGAFLNLWHPGWLIFFLIPVYYILYPSKKEIQGFDEKDEITDIIKPDEDI